MPLDVAVPHVVELPVWVGDEEAEEEPLDVANPVSLPVAVPDPVTLLVALPVGELVAQPVPAEDAVPVPLPLAVAVAHADALGFRRRFPGG